MKSLKEKIKNWKEYSRISDLGIIARRKFFNNCFDGALTCAGIVSGIFIIFLAGSDNITTNNVIITGFATALAIGISGLWGAFLSEEAERRKKVADMKKDMAILEEIVIDNPELVELERKRHMRKKNKSLLEKAEYYTTVVASLVDGGSPVLGSSLPLIPFFLGQNCHTFILLLPI